MRLEEGREIIRNVEFYIFHMELKTIYVDCTDLELETI